MKLLPVLLLLGFSLSICNLTKSKTAAPGGSSTSSSSDSVVPEKANPSAAQTAALAGGETVKWDEQGMSWTIPPKWTKVESDRNSFTARSPGGFDAANLIVSISAMAEDFPTDSSLKATFDQAKTRMK